MAAFRAIALAEDFMLAVLVFLLFLVGALSASLQQLALGSSERATSSVPIYLAVVQDGLRLRCQQCALWAAECLLPRAGLRPQPRIDLRQSSGLNTGKQ